MRYLLITLVLLFGIESVAQNYQPPSRERVETLLTKLETCKDALKDLESSIKYMEDNPGKFTLQQYNEAKLWRNMAKGCIDDTRRDLDDLRKDYPGWFSGPNSVMNLGRGHEIRPKDLDRMLNEVSVKINKVLNRFKAIKSPE